MRLKQLNQTIAEALELRDRPYVRYAGSPPGFGCRVTPNGARSWIFEYRPGGSRSASTRRMTIGRIDALHYAKARRAAEALYHRTRLGEDPAGVRDSERAAPTIDAIVERYMTEEIRPARKPSTVDLYTKYFKNHIAPAIGRKQAAVVTYSDIARLHRAIGGRGTQVAANRVVSLVSSLYNWAGKAGEVPRGTNPARDVTRFASRLVPATCRMPRSRAWARRWRSPKPMACLMRSTVPNRRANTHPSPRTDRHGSRHMRPGRSGCCFSPAAGSARSLACAGTTSTSNALC